MPKSPASLQESSPLSSPSSAPPFARVNSPNCSNMVPNSYFLRSQRLGFRWWTSEDLAFATALWGDLEVTKFFGGPFSEEEIQRRLQVELDRAAAHDFQYWPMHLLDDGEFVGCCGLRPFKLD